MFLKNTLLILIWIKLLNPECLVAQLPNSDIWLFKISKKDNRLVIQNPVNITNRVGYDNQPVFSNNGKQIYYSSIREDKQSDIYCYSISGKKTKQCTKTTESEYSPNIGPDENVMSALVVLSDSSQKIITYDLKTFTQKAIVSETDSIGYYEWLNKDSIVYYKLTQPHSLRVMDLSSKSDVWICNDPARSFKKIGNSSSFIYASKDTAEVSFWIYNPVLREAIFYAKHNSLNEDFVWSDVYGLIKSNNNELIYFDEKLKKWNTLFDFKTLGLTHITRFVFNAKFNYLAIVVNKQ